MNDTCGVRRMRLSSSSRPLFAASGFMFWMSAAAVRLFPFSLGFGVGPDCCGVDVRVQPRRNEMNRSRMIPAGGLLAAAALGFGETDGGGTPSVAG
jgi:hypothetical protein